MWERIRTMLAKEFIQIFRDPRMRMVIFVVPVIQLVVFGYAATTDVRNAATAIFDLDNTPASREFISRFTASGCFQAIEYVDDEARAQEMVDRGLVYAVIRIDKGFEQDLDAGRTARVQLILDGTDSNTAGIILSYAGNIASRFSRDIILSRFDRRQGAGQRPGQIDLRSRAWFNENLESRNFYVPGVMANLVTLITLMLTSMAVVREREIGTMEQVMVTPIRPLEFILGKTVPFVLVAFIDVLLVTGVGVFWFGVPIRGNLLLLLACTGLYLLPAVGMGLLVSTVCQTQQQAMLSTFFVFFPVMLLSGFAFPIANMPQPVKWLTYANPMRYFLTIIRSIFLKGVGISVLWPDMAGLAVIGILLLLLAVRRFHKTLG
jgi:ABC-2 type transport system permease protein